MDFDPSQFLAVDIEEQNSTYTAPDVPSAPPPMVEFPSIPITMEGGLQMEQNMHIAAPTFGLFGEGMNGGDVLENGNVDEQGYVNGMPMLKGLPSDYLAVVTDTDKDSSPLPSPADRSSSPHLKKIIPTSSNESRFRRDFFCGDYEKVKLFRLHCTICDRHLGCAPWITERQMRQHKMLAVPVCRQCFDFYGDIKFPVEDGSEIYCFWCGQGGDLFCCSSCPKVLCKDCVRRNFGSKEVTNIEKNDDWICMVCKSEEIWPHRAILFGLQRYSKECRMRVAALSKEEKQLQLSKDRSHCCPSKDLDFVPVKLAYKRLMSKIPMVLIANVYQKSVLEQPDPPKSSFVSNMMNMSSLLNNNVRTSTPPIPPQPQRLAIMGPTQRPPQQPTQRPLMQQRLQTQPSPRPSVMLPPNQVFHSPARNVISRQPRPFPRPHHGQSPYNRPPTPMPSRSLPALPQPSEVIDLEDDSPQKSHTPLYDIGWLAKSVNNIKETLIPVHMMLDQFKLNNNELTTDFSKLTTFSDRITYNIKIAICNLAKINQDIADNKKIALDTQVSSVVASIEKSVTNQLLSRTITTTRILPIQAPPSVNSAPPSVNSASPSVNSASPQRPKETLVQPRTPDANVRNDLPRSTPPSADDDVGLNPALLCETVMEEGNKENKISNMPPKNAPINKSVLNKRQSTLKFKKTILKNPSPVNKKSDSDIQIIDLSDDESENKFDATFYCKKFNVKLCKVILVRCDTKRN